MAKAKNKSGNEYVWLTAQQFDVVQYFKTDSHVVIAAELGGPYGVSSYINYLELELSSNFLCNDCKRMLFIIDRPIVADIISY